METGMQNENLAHDKRTKFTVMIVHCSKIVQFSQPIFSNELSC